METSSSSLVDSKIFHASFTLPHFDTCPLVHSQGTNLIEFPIFKGAHEFDAPSLKACKPKHAMSKRACVKGSESTNPHRNFAKSFKLLVKLILCKA